MKNTLIFLLALTLYSCGDNKPDTTVTRDEDQLLVGQVKAIDNKTARIMISKGVPVYYQVDIVSGDTSFRIDTTWHLYVQPVDTIPDVNKPPVVNAGNDQTIILPANSVTITGFGSDPEGEDITYQWIKMTGTGGTITNPTSPSTIVTGLTAGSYLYRLAVTDEDGAVGTDDVSITVKPVVIISTIEGYGNATGGASYETVTITNLSQIQSNIKSNRTLLVNVSGTMGKITISGVSNFTIDCYSTKQDVTCLGGSGDGININNSTNVIVRGFKSTKWGNDGINITGNSQRIAIDHCTSWDNGDGNIDIATSNSGGKNTTVQWSVMGLSRGTGNMLGTTINSSIHHNLFIGDGSGEGSERNPFFHSNYAPKGSQSNPNFDVRNNVMHASGRYVSGNGFGAVGNYIDNYYTSNKSCLINLCADGNSCGTAYTRGNFNQPNSCGGTNNNVEYTIPPQYRINTTDAVTAAKSILANVGTWKRGSYEQDHINSINIGTPNPTVCTDYNYSAWSACNNGTQTRTVTGFTPGGCTGNPLSQPVLSRNCSTDPPPTGGYTLVYSTGYDDVNSIDPFGHGQWGAGSQASHLSTTIFKTGPGSFKSGPLANVSSGTRSEVQYGSAQSPLEGILEYDAYYDNFFSNSGHSLQWHPSTGGGSGTGPYHKNGKMQFVTVKSGTSGTNVGNPFTVTTKVWHHFKYTYKFGPNGYIRIELDGVEVVNQNVQMGDGSDPYLKTGVNMWVNQTSVVYYDNLKVYRKQ